MSKLATALGTNFPPGTIITKPMLADIRAIQENYAETRDNEIWRCCACGQITQHGKRLTPCNCADKACP